MLLSVKNTAIASVAALALALGGAAPAQALGKNERNFLKGVAAAVIVGAIVKDMQRPRATQPTYVAPQPVYVPPQPVPQPKPSYSVYQTPAAKAFNSYPPQDRRLIQSRLAAYGYYRSGIDGSFGPGTYRAVQAYARDSRIDDRLTTMNGMFTVYDSLMR
jgi:hypothetical protein